MNVAVDFSPQLWLLTLVLVFQVYSFDQYSVHAWSFSLR